MKRDSQRSKLYKWELNNFEKTSTPLLPAKARRPLSESELNTLSEEVWTEWGLDGAAPLVRVMGNRGRGTAQRFEIKLSSRYIVTLHEWYALHELTHSAIAERGLFNKVASHGPEFCALYASFLHRFAGGSRKEIVESMRAAGLKVGTELS